MSLEHMSYMKYNTASTTAASTLFIKTRCYIAWDQTNHRTSKHELLSIDIQPEANASSRDTVIAPACHTSPPLLLPARLPLQPPQNGRTKPCAQPHRSRSKYFCLQGRSYVEYVGRRPIPRINDMATSDRGSAYSSKTGRKHETKCRVKYQAKRVHTMDRNCAGTCTILQHKKAYATPPPLLHASSITSATSPCSPHPSPHTQSTPPLDEQSDSSSLSSWDRIRPITNLW